jgi:hypothetical protein
VWLFQEVDLAEMPNQTSAANAGWRLQFRFAVHVLRLAVPEQHC